MKIKIQFKNNKVQKILNFYNKIFKMKILKMILQLSKVKEIQYLLIIKLNKTGLLKMKMIRNKKMLQIKIYNKLIKIKI